MKTTLNERLVPITLVAAIALAACGGGSSDSAASDTEQNCRIAQRLVDEKVDGDLDGVERQLERLSEVENIDDLIDLDELDDLAQDSADGSAADLADELDDELDCAIDVPEVVEPVATNPVEPTLTEPPSTDAPTTEPVDTDPPATEPSATTDAPAPSEPGEALAVVDIGATGPGIDRPELAQVPADALVESGISVLPIPAGDAIAIEYRVGYDVDGFADSTAYSANESFTFSAATEMTIDDVRIAFVDSITSSYDTEFTATDSTSSRDETTQTGTSLSPERSREGIPRYDVVVVSSTDLPGVVLIELTAADYRDGPLPELTSAAQVELGPAAAIGADFGWTREGWDWSNGFNQFSGAPSVSGNLDWAIGSGSADDVAPAADQLLAVLPTPTFEDVEPDRHFYIIDDENWTIRYSDSYEGAELRAGYAYSV